MAELEKKNAVQTIQSELRKIHWPSKQEVVKYTYIVIGVSILFSLIIFGFDQVFGKLIGLLLK